MKYPSHYGTEQNLAAATQCDQNDRSRGLRGRQDDWAGPHRDTKLWKLARTISAQISSILESGSGAFQMSERRSSLGKIGVERLLKSARIILNRAIATRVFPNSPSASFEHDWFNRSSCVQSRLIARMHIDARSDELFGTERTQSSKVSVKSIAGQKYERDLALSSRSAHPLANHWSGAGTRCADLITAALNDNLVKLAELINLQM